MSVHMFFFFHTVQNYDHDDSACFMIVLVLKILKSILDKILIIGFIIWNTVTIIIYTSHNPSLWHMWSIIYKFEIIEVAYN
jgi:hypothetical protein